MKILLLGDENFSFVSGFLLTHPHDEVEVASCLAEDQLKDETKAVLDQFKEKGLHFHFRVNPAQMKSTFAEGTFDKMVYILPGIAFHGSPDFIETKSEMFKLRLHFFCFGFLKSVKPFIKVDGEVLFLWPDFNDETVPFAHIEIDKLAKFCYVQRVKSNDIPFEPEYHEEWKPMIHNITKTTIPEWIYNAHYYTFRMDEDSKSENSKIIKKRKRFPPVPGEDKKEGEDAPNESANLEDEDTAKADDFNILKVPPEIFNFERNQLPHVNECFHFKLWGKNSQSFQVSKLTLKYDPRISGWKGDGSPNKPNKEVMYRNNRPMRGMKNDLMRPMGPPPYNMHSNNYHPYPMPNSSGAQGPGGPPPPPPQLAGGGGVVGHPQHQQHHLLPSHHHNAPPTHPHHFPPTQNAAGYPAGHLPGVITPGPKPNFPPAANAPPQVRGQLPPPHQAGHATPGPGQQQQPHPTHLRHPPPHDPNYRNANIMGPGGPHYAPPIQGGHNQQPPHAQQPATNISGGAVNSTANRLHNYPYSSGSPQAGQSTNISSHPPPGVSTPRSTPVNPSGSTLGSARAVQMKKPGSTEPVGNALTNAKRPKTAPSAHGASGSTSEFPTDDTSSHQGPPRAPSSNFSSDPYNYNNSSYPPEYPYPGGYNEVYPDANYGQSTYDPYRGPPGNFDGYSGYEGHQTDYPNHVVGGYDTSQYPPMDYPAPPPNDYYGYGHTNYHQGYGMMNNMGYYDSTVGYAPPSAETRGNYNFDYSNQGYDYRGEFNNNAPPPQGYVGEDYNYDNARGYGPPQSSYDSTYFPDGSTYTPQVNNYTPKTSPPSSTEKVSTSSVGNSHPSNASYNQYGRY